MANRKPLIENERFVRIAAPVAVGIALLMFWQVGVVVSGVKPYILPGPAAVLHALFTDGPTLLWSLLETMEVTFLAFLLAVVLGTATALVFVQSKWIERSFFPYAVLLQVTPIVAIAPLIIIWIKDTQLALVVCATIIAIFPVISNTTLGLNSVNHNLKNVFEMYRASRWQTLMQLRIPGALPYFFGGLRISSGLALIGAVVAEFVAGTGGSRAGLAYQILQAGYNLQIPKMFAALLLIAVAGIALFGLMVWLSNRALGRWHESVLRPEN
ncbi:MAG: ABC transporter permease [Gammaproteobacteria bacterium]